ncbi:MAG: hypothetical protein AB8G95_10105 [Anaerolineae bacterium]
MSNILVICTGNVCRSPVVERLLVKRLAQRNLVDWTVHSAGTGEYPPRSASRFSVEVIEETESIDLMNHQSKVATQAMVQQADLIVCMEANHKEILSLENPTEASKIFLLSEMVPGPIYDVPDPYSKNKQAYEMMVKTVTGLVDEGLERIIELAS